jgi:hypothetical protein
MLLAGAGAVLWSREHTPQDTLAVRSDVPIRLLQWAVALLRADRVEWGQAMLGELDQIEIRSKRWRFALGCVAGVVLLPPWGPVGPVAALVAVALGSALVFGFGFVHFGLATNPWNWVMLAILAAVVTGSIVAVSVLLRRPGVAGPGLVSGFLRRGDMVGVLWVHVCGHHQPDQFGGRLVRPGIVDRGAIGRGGGWRVAQRKRPCGPADRSTGWRERRAGPVLRLHDRGRGDRRRIARPGGGGSPGA